MISILPYNEVPKNIVGNIDQKDPWSQIPVTFNAAGKINKVDKNTFYFYLKANDNITIDYVGDTL